eukprot:TRINITY_DN32312_c0_g1_i1.p1 TRINITY_DN32312_c0_g1~~TRINITY_DN32312_c0_g1_i1.p1  ORF type:complete len:642 (+),score=192.83 TRINITY_DN32312_c0_g1_i1:56-1927(+)
MHAAGRLLLLHLLLRPSSSDAQQVRGKVGADGCPWGAAWCSVGRSFGAADEEPPEDERMPDENSQLAPQRPVFCRVWQAGVAEPERQGWQPAGMPVERFRDGAELREFFSSNPDAGCVYAHVVSGPGAKTDDPRWLHKVIEALHGNLEREAVITHLDNDRTCKSFTGVKRLGLIERERCHLTPVLGNDYAWCKCHQSRRTPKSLICVPDTHKFYLNPSPLLGQNMTCVARLSYKPQHLRDVAAPTYTPHKPYPTEATSARAAALAYINSERVLEGTAETFRTWVPHFLVPQGIDLFLIREETRIQEEDVVRLFRLQPDGDGYYSTVRGVRSTPVYLSKITEAFPPGVDPAVLGHVRPRCGCPPLCTGPTPRSPDGFMINGLRYVQGTSVFTYELLKDGRLREYDFLIKLDWDIRFFRTLREQLIPQVVDAKAIGFHTGFANNGNGCSRGTQISMDTYAESQGTRAKSAGDWLYENEALAWHSALFGLWTGLLFSKEYQDLMNALRNGPHALSWFRYRWTDQSVWPKVVGYFHHDMATALLDMRHMRWNPHAPRPKSVFYHRKKQRHDSELCCGPCTDEERACFKQPWKKRSAGGSLGKTSAYIWCARAPGNVSHRIDLDLCER